MSVKSMFPCSTSGYPGQGYLNNNYTVLIESMVQEIFYITIVDRPRKFSKSPHVLLIIGYGKIRKIN